MVGREALAGAGRGLDESAGDQTQTAEVVAHGEGAAHAQAVGLVELRGQGYAVQSGARRPILHHYAGFKNPPSCGNFNRVLGSGVLLRPVSAGVARGASRARCLEIQDEE